MSKNVEALCDRASKLVEAANRAWADDDKVAFVKLLTAAAQCTQLARSLQDMNDAAARLKAAGADKETRT